VPGNVNLTVAGIQGGTTGVVPTNSKLAMGLPIVPTPGGNPVLPSNASVPGDFNVNAQQPDATNSMSLPAGQFYDLTAWSTTADTNIGVGPAWLGNHNGISLLLANGTNPPPPGLPGTPTYPIYGGIYDGSNTVNGRVLPVTAFQAADMRQHPYFRSEWMQRMMNLSTVRTHQYAVWITVGFFEVVQSGNPQLAFTNPAQAYDQLGMELGALEGKQTRYRGFFILDRTRATGFNPTNPGDFRDVIVYRKQIQ
jgi:hypothetical protein